MACCRQPLGLGRPSPKLPEPQLPLLARLFHSCPCLASVFRVRQMINTGPQWNTTMKAGGLRGSLPLSISPSCRQVSSSLSSCHHAASWIPDRLLSLCLKVSQIFMTLWLELKCMVSKCSAGWSKASCCQMECVHPPASASLLTLRMVLALPEPFLCANSISKNQKNKTKTPQICHEKFELSPCRTNEWN